MTFDQIQAGRIIPRGALHPGPVDVSAERQVRTVDAGYSMPEEVSPASLISHRGVSEPGPMIAADQDWMSRNAAVDRARQHARASAGEHPGNDVLPHVGKIDEVDHRGLRISRTRGLQPRTQRRTHALVPLLRDHRDHLVGNQLLSVLSTRPKYHDHGIAPTRTKCGCAASEPAVDESFRTAVATPCSSGKKNPDDLNRLNSLHTLFVLGHVPHRRRTRPSAAAARPVSRPVLVAE